MMNRGTVPLEYELDLSALEEVGSVFRETHLSDENSEQ